MIKCLSKRVGNLGRYDVMFVQFNDALSFGVESNGQGTSLTLSLFHPLCKLQVPTTSCYLSFYLLTTERGWNEAIRREECLDEAVTKKRVNHLMYFWGVIWYVTVCLKCGEGEERRSIPYSRCGKDRPLVGVSSWKSMMNVSTIDGLSSCPELI